jgi:hypothetical protein
MGKRSIGDRFREWVDRWFRTIILTIIVSILIAAVISFAHIETIINQIPDMKDALTRIEEHTKQLNDMKTTITGIEERSKDIGDMKAGVDKLLGRFGIAEVTPASGGSLSANNVQIDIPPNSVAEPTYFSLDKISSANLPATLPNNNYQYSDGIILSSIGDNVKVNAQAKWDLVSFGANCEEAKILYWNPINDMWQEVLPQSCTPTGIIGFNAQNGTLYILTKEK